MPSVRPSVAALIRCGSPRSDRSLAARFTQVVSDLPDAASRRSQTGRCMTRRQTLTLVTAILGTAVVTIGHPGHRIVDRRGNAGVGEMLAHARQWEYPDGGDQRAGAHEQTWPDAVGEGPEAA
jgi:hypothetical protein